MNRLKKFVAVIAMGVLVPALASAETGYGSGSAARSAADSFVSAASGGRPTSRQDQELAKRLENLKAVVTEYQPKFKKWLDEMTEARDARDEAAKFSPIPGIAEAQVAQRDKAKQQRAAQAVAALGNGNVPFGGASMQATLATAEESCKSPSYSQADTLGKFLLSKPIQDSRQKLDQATRPTPEQEAAEIASLVKFKQATLAAMDAANRSKFEQEDSKRDVPRNKIDLDKEKVFLKGKTEEFKNEKQDIERKFVGDMIDLQIKLRKRSNQQQDIARIAGDAQGMFSQFLQPTCDSFKAGMAENVKTCKRKRVALGTMSAAGTGSGLWGRIYQAARSARVVLSEVFEAKDEIGDANDLECRDNSQQIDGDLCGTGQAAIQSLSSQTTYEGLAGAIRDISTNLGNALQSAGRSAAATVADCNEAVIAEKEAKKVQQKVGGMGRSEEGSAPRTASGTPRPGGAPWAGGPGGAPGARSGFPGHSGAR